ncbi:MAG: hypothetical protein KDB63_06395 [Nocardioidaceae bacterium]|nr:hypothetical protein [Nocardioidaceae bacterium]
MRTTLRGGRRRTALLVAVALSSATLSLTACSGGGASPADEEPSSESSSAEPTSSESPTESPTDSPTGTPSGGTGRFDPSLSVTVTRNPVFRTFTTDDQLFTMDRDGVASHALPDVREDYVIVPPAGYAPIDTAFDAEAGVGVLMASRVVGGSGTTAGRTSFDLTGFALDSGDPEGHARVSVRESTLAGASPPVARIRGMAGQVMIVDSWVAVGTTKIHTALGVDLSTGEVVWRRAGQALAGTGRVALVSTGTPGAAGAILGLAPATGEVRWSTLDGTQAAALVGVTDRRAIVVRLGGFGSTTIVPIDLRTGAAGRPRQGTTVEWNCRMSTPTVAVCLLPQGVVVGWGMVHNRQLWALPTKARYAPTVTLVARGELWGTLQDGWVSLDSRTGADLASGTGGTPLAVNAFGALFRTDIGAVWLPDPTQGLPAATSPSDGSSSPSADESSAG